MPETPSEKKPGVPWITMHSEPYPIPPEIAQEVSSILIQWSQFENGIVLDTSQYMRLPHIRNLTKDAPRNFKGKVELWKKCVHTLFPSVEPYKRRATAICSDGKIMARHRHRLVHGTWRPSEKGEPGDFQVYTHKGLETIEEFERFWVDVEYLNSVHRGIRALSDAIHEFIANRMWHAHLGLLRPRHEP